MVPDTGASPIVSAIRPALFAVLLILVCAGFSQAQDASPEASANNGEVELSQLEKQQKQLIQITQRRILLGNELKELKASPESQVEPERIEEIESELTSLNKKFESMATQLKEAEFKDHDQSELSWTQELQEITKPLLLALREITERPRKIENLKTWIQSLKDQIATYEGAQKNLEELMALEVKQIESLENSKTTAVRHKEIKENFKEKLADLKEKYNPDYLKLDLEEGKKQLNELQDTDISVFKMTSGFMRDFFQVRGRNLLIAVTTFLIFWAFLYSIYWVLANKTKLLARLDSHYQKVVKAAYRLLIFGVCTTASIVSLYLLDDWLILSIVILICVGMALAFREFIPGFIQELRLILNLGTVREGERMIWQGIPWLVQEIGVYVILRNARLQGGLLKLTVGELVGHHSRPLVHEEEWFPTRVDDWVILSDDTYGRVVKQTSEQVILECLSSRRYFPTAEFLQMSPKNLSTGFRILVHFGLDYGVQSKICTDLPELFENRLRQEFNERLEGEDPDFKSLNVQFDSAQASSLNLLVSVKVDGRCAGDYFFLQRKINGVLVQVCNENGLTIPFNQLTLSPSQDLKSLVQKGAESDFRFVVDNPPESRAEMQ